MMSLARDEGLQGKEGAGGAQKEGDHDKVVEGVVVVEGGAGGGALGVIGGGLVQLVGHPELEGEGQVLERRAGLQKDQKIKLKRAKGPRGEEVGQIAGRMLSVRLSPR
jgi:hypothetical protein